MQGFKQKLFRIGAIIISFLIVLLVMIVVGKNLSSDCCQCAYPPEILNIFDRQCCPCPNYDYYDEVIAYIGYKPACGGVWQDMCRQYQREINKTFNCWND